MGSLYTAVASYLDARAHGGRWLVRIEDLDRPRVVAGSMAGILRTLRAFGFEWDDEVLQQSNRNEAYAEALRQLTSRNLTFECTCSRTQLGDADRYPGHCRDRVRDRSLDAAIRLRIDSAPIEFADRIQGLFRQDVATAYGDAVLRRRDGIMAYLLAVVIDDDAQGVTHVVRGADLLDDTPRQIHLQRLLGLRTLEYAHVPVLTEPDGKKLAKSGRSVRLDESGGSALAQLMQVFEWLGLPQARERRLETVFEAWDWAISQWNISRVPRHLMRRLGP